MSKKNIVFVVLIVIIIILFVSLMVVLSSKNTVFTVTLDYCYENKSDTYSIKNNSTFNPPSATRLAHNFKGWYKDSACTVPWVNGEDEISSDITLYAKWEYVGGTFDIFD